jgi:hypothetical protein
MARDSSHRHRGQVNGSWAARNLARLGETALGALVAMSFIAPAPADAAGHGSAPDPSPQPAPSVTSPTPAPDPVPQASERAIPMTTSPVSTPPVYEPSSSSSTGTGTANVGASSGTTSTPVGSSSGSGTTTVQTTSAPPTTVHAKTNGAPSAHTGSPSPRHAADPGAPPRRVADTHRAAPRIAPFPFTLSLPRSLLELPRAAFRAGVQDHDSGVLLLFSSLAMAVLAVASFGLLRRLKRLDESVR